MRIARAASQRLALRGSIRTRGSRTRPGAKVVTAGLLAAGSLTALAATGATPASASASTLDGIASIANPVTLAVSTSGASTSQFTVTLPGQSACDGDTATHGYHVYSYLLPKGTAVPSATFETYPSSGYGLVDNIGTYYGPINTAIGTGQIVGIPNTFEWGPLVSNDGVPLSTLLYTGSGSTATGVWETGLACATSTGSVADYWNTEVTFSASSTDTNGFVWSAVPGPSGSAPAAFTSTASTTFTQNSPGDFTPAASGSPAPVITESGALPTGVTFTGGALTGTPTGTGNYPITLTATNGIESPAVQHFTLHVVAPIPVVNAVSPSAGPASGGTSVTITGTGLGSATAVDFGATAASVTADTPTSITATAPAGTGTVDVTVTTTGGTSATSVSDQFSYAGSPVVSGITPTTGPASGGTSVTITGSNLGNAISVDFGSNAATVAADTATSITATAPAGTGTVDVTVTTVGGTSSPIPADRFTYGVAPAFTSATSATFVTGTHGSFTPAATGSPTPTITETGTLPAGVTFTGGVLSGTPTASGSFPITFTATNGIGAPVTQNFTLTVVVIEITTTSLPGATQNSPYSATLTELGGVAPVKWTTNVHLPKGLKLNKATGVISGTTSKKATTGTFPIVVTVTDHAKPVKDTASVTLSITVSA